jgi:hypothetical protein
MSGAASIAELFSPEPYWWGLRGDPWLWRDMQQRFSAVSLPATEDDLAAIIAATFEQLTGHPITHPEHIHLPQYSHGGMSSGMVMPEWWRETAIPLLRERYAG